jgi:hypothetical protein
VPIPGPSPDIAHPILHHSEGYHAGSGVRPITAGQRADQGEAIGSPGDTSRLVLTPDGLAALVVSILPYVVDHDDLLRPRCRVSPGR